MEIAVFCSKRKTNEGKTFNQYLTTLEKKDGEKVVMQVRFKDDCQPPSASQCPMYIEVPRETSNVSTRKYQRRDTGETCISYTLWVTSWVKTRDYVDTSLDEFNV